MLTRIRRVSKQKPQGLRSCWKPAKSTVARWKWAPCPWSSMNGKSGSRSQALRHSGTQALLDTARGYIKAVNQRRLIVGLEPDGWSKWIALERIKTLTLAGSLTQRSADRDSTQVASGRAVRWLGETPDTLSGRTQKRDAKGTGKRIAKKLVGGTSAGLAGGIAGSWWGPFWMTVVGPLLY